MKPYYERDGIVIYHGDCREILPTLEPVDLVLTDPPYGIGEKWTEREMVGANGASRLWGKRERWDDAPFDGIECVVAKGRYAIIFGGNYYTLGPTPRWLIWDKVQEFSGADAELAWTNLPGVTRVFRMSRIDAYHNFADVPKSHPCEKPLPLMRWCIQQAAVEGMILDPFMGSGTTLRAAKDLGRKAIGIEIEEQYCEIAAKRLSQEVLAL